MGPGGLGRGGLSMKNDREPRFHLRQGSLDPTIYYVIQWLAAQEWIREVWERLADYDGPEETSVATCVFFLDAPAVE